MKRTVSVVGVYSVIHAVVDFACAMLLAGLVSPRIADNAYALLAVYLSYNFFAFAMQFPIGIIADSLDKNALVSAVGCVVIAAAYLLYPVGVLAAIVAGIGNAMFHVGGGIDVLNISDRKATLPGIFVATGALGLYVGAQCNTLGWNRYPVTAVVLLLAAATLVWLYRKAHGSFAIRNATPPILRDYPRAELIIAGCMLLTIGIRGGFGLVMNFTWKNGFRIGLITVCAVVLGKMLGGVVGDRLGWRRTTVISLALSAVLFIFAYDSMAAGIAAIFLFNMSMPITLTALANRFEKQRGMAFGLTTVALFVGALPVLFGYGKWLFLRPVLVIATAASAAVLWYGLRRYERAEREDGDA